MWAADEQCCDLPSGRRYFEHPPNYQDTNQAHTEFNPAN